MPFGFRFSGEQKLGLFFIMYIYTTFILSIILVQFWGAWSFLLGFSSFPIMQGITFTYHLYMYKKVHEEIEGVKYLIGWLITMDGKWHNVDIPIKGWEEMSVTDQEMQEYENKKQFQDTITEVKRNNPELEELIDDDDNDVFVSTSVAKEYKECGLTTSRQIYCYELIRKFLKDKPTEIEKINKELAEISIESFGDKTTYLENKMVEINLNEDDIKRIISNESGYYDRTLQLENVAEIGRDPKEYVPIIKRTNIIFVFILLSIILNIILGNVYVSIGSNFTVVPEKPNREDIVKIFANVTTIGISILVITIINILIITFLTIFLFKTIKVLRDKIKEPNKIVFQNKINTAINTDMLCSIRTKLNELQSDSYLYRLFPLQDDKENTDPKKEIFGRIWSSDEVYMVLPEKFGTTFEFETGYIGHRGQGVAVPTASVVMIEIGRIFHDPMYRVIGSSYHFKAMIREYHNYNTIQNLKNKVYQYIIAEYETKLGITKVDLQNTQMRVKKWQLFAVGGKQHNLTDDITRVNEVGKGVRNLTVGEEGAESGQPTPEQIAQYQEAQKQEAAAKKKKQLKIGLIVMIVVILVVAVALYLVSNSTQVVTPKP